MSQSKSVNILKEIERKHDEQEFVNAYNDMAFYAAQHADEKGFHTFDLPWETMSEQQVRLAESLIRSQKMLLMMTEIAEACEGERHGNPESDHIPEFSALEEEMADLLIRVMTEGVRNGWRIPQAVVVKMRFNETRPYKHGGKAF